MRELYPSTSTTSCYPVTSTTPRYPVTSTTPRMSGWTRQRSS